MVSIKVLIWRKHVTEKTSVGDREVFSSVFNYYYIYISLGVLACWG